MMLEEAVVIIVEGPKPTTGMFRSFELKNTEGVTVGELDISNFLFPPTDELTGAQVQAFFVTGANVIPELKGQGVGSNFYIEVAKVLGAEGFVLAASNTQSSDAVKLWDRFIENAGVPTVRLKTSKRITWALDFRK